MVPIKEAISSGAWLNCEHEFGYSKYQFRLKINSIEKINISMVDNPEEIKNMDVNSNIWKMDIEVISLNKKPLPVRYGPNSLILIDQDGFHYPIFEDRHLHMRSEFSKKSNLFRFYVYDLLPKIKAVGSIAFLLPDDNEAEYFISIENEGIVEEV